MSVFITVCLTTALLIICTENSIPKQIESNELNKLANALFNYAKNPDSHLQTIRTIINKGMVDVNGQCPEINPEMNMIQTAADYASAEAVEALLQAGAEVDRVTPEDPETALVKAVQRGQLDIVEKLLQHKASTESVDSLGHPLLETAVEIRCHEIAETLLESGAKPDFVTSSGYTPLIEAMKNMDYEMTEILEKYHADYFYGDCDDITALSWSIIVGYEEKALEILDGMKPEMVRRIGQFPNGKPELFFAIENGMVDVVRELLKRNYPLQLVDSDKNTALHVTAASGCKEIMGEILLKKAIDVNAKNNNDETALHVAARYGHLNVATILLKTAIDVDAKNNDGETALHIAVRSEDINVATVLIDNGASMIARNGRGDAAVHIAVQHRHLPMLKLLAQKRGNIDLENAQGNTALNIAAMGASYDLVESLIKLNANINHVDSNGNTALHEFVKLGQLVPNIIGKLMDLGSDMTVADSNKMTPFDLSLSESYNEKEVINEFFKHDPDIVNRADTMGRTSLHRAAMHGWDDVIHKLLEMGADVDLKDNDGMTPFELSLRDGDVDLKDNDGMTPFELSLRDGNYKEIVVDEFLNHDPDIVNRADTMGRTSLHRAAMHGWDDGVIRELLRLGAHVDLVDTDGNTPRQLAVLNNNQSAVDLIDKQQKQTAAAVDLSA